MTLYQCLPFVMIVLLIIFIMSVIFQKKKSLPVELFFQGLKYENDGHFEEAISNYENALNEAKKNRFHSDLENKIVQKIKILHTIIEYNNSLGFTR